MQLEPERAYVCLTLFPRVLQNHTGAVKFVSQAVVAADQAANAQSVTLSSHTSSCKSLCVRWVLGLRRGRSIGLRSEAR